MDFLAATQLQPTIYVSDIPETANDAKHSRFARVSILGAGQERSIEKQLGIFDATAIHQG